MLALRWARGGNRARMPGRWWPVVAVQAGLDVSGYYTLHAATSGSNPEIAAMAASAYYVVTVILSNIFFEERISLRQAGGIATVFAGVALLSA